MKKILSILCAAFMLGSCSDFLEEYSQDLSKVETYTDLDEVLMGEGYLPVGEYDVSYGGLADGVRCFQSIHFMSDELVNYINSKSGDYAGILDEMFGYHTWQQVVGLSFDRSTTYAEDGDLNQTYKSINVCNMVLDAIDEQKAENEEQELEKSRIKGEAAFLRALYYFELVNLYGKPYCEANLSSPSVPIKLSPVVEDMDYTCNTVEEVYGQIVEDLNLADTCLVNAKVKNHPYRADITAVYLLKSRVYLYMQDWEKALEYAQKTLEKNSGLLDLNSFSGGEVLSKTSPETIFSMGGHLLSTSIQRDHGINSWGEYANVPVYVMSDDLINAFDEGDNDLRTKYYITKDTVGSDGYSPIPFTVEWTFRKVYGWEVEKKDVSDSFLFRTAEAYLNGAEAAAILGDEATARALLKTLRDNRMADSRAITESGQALVDLIRMERQRELCLEGHRWFDLRRYMVRNPYTYTKEIVHYYTEYDSEYSDGQPVQTWSYKLEANDEAYTLALPQEIRDFQPTVGTNNRPARAGSSYTPPADEEIDTGGDSEYDEGYDVGYEDGYAAGQKDAADDLYYEGAYYDDYNSPYEYGSEADDGYYWGFEDGYYDGYYGY